MKNKIEVVLINWKRPHNISKIVTSLRNQSIQCTITLCDCHIEEVFALDKDTIGRIDRLYRWSHNLGAYSRYLPLSAFDHEYTFFIDDDMLPGCRCLEYYYKCAGQLKNFGVLGQLGRVIDQDGIYRPKYVPMKDIFVETDIIIRAYFVKTKYLYNIVRFRWYLNYFYDELPEDDILLCVSLKFYENLSCYLLPINEDVETLVNREELPDDYSLCRRPEHYVKRMLFVKKLISYGWNPLYLR